jgi:hypothetical protein
MPSKKYSDTYKARRQAALDELVGPLELRELILQLKMVYAQNAVMIAKQHNTDVELSRLKASLDKVITAIVEVHDEPTKLGEVQAVLRDFLNKAQSQNNRKGT